LPFVEQDHLFGQFDPAKGFVPNSAGAMSVVKIYLCPSARKSPEVPLTNYIAMSGLGEDALTSPLGAQGNGLMGYNRASSFKDISDGLSNTIGIAETNSSLGHWAKGGPSTLRAINASEPSLLGADRLLGSLHSKGLNVAMCDGSVRFLSSKTSSQVLADMITIAGGEQINPD
jgi:prepilin-type processing-associated H-X9-DG protein